MHEREIERKRREGASGNFKCDGRYTSFEPFLFFHVHVTFYGHTWGTTGYHGLCACCGCDYPMIATWPL